MPHSSAKSKDISPASDGGYIWQERGFALKARIAGTGSFLPDKVLSNSDLEKMVDTSDEWIVQRSGIRERRVCAEGETIVTMGTAAARKALENAGIDALDIDMIVLSTSSLDYFFPSAACRVQREIGAKNAFAFDLMAACTGSVYALDIAAKQIEAGAITNALAIASEKVTSVVDFSDRATCVLFGDAAGAAVLSCGESGILSSYLASDPDNWESLYAEIPGKTVMNGKDVYKFAVSAMPEAISKVLDKAGKTLDDVRWLIPHQANIRIIDYVINKYKLPKDKVVITIDRYGNTSSASVMVALDELNSQGKLSSGDLILPVSFGAGLTYGAILLEW